VGEASWTLTLWGNSQHLKLVARKMCSNHGVQSTKTAQRERFAQTRRLRAVVRSSPPTSAQNAQTARTVWGTFQGPFTNTIRTPTCKACWGINLNPILEPNKYRRKGIPKSEAKESRTLEAGLTRVRNQVPRDCSEYGSDYFCRLALIPGSGQ
jgi:hypothetical protein